MKVWRRILYCFNYDEEVLSVLSPVDANLLLRSFSNPQIPKQVVEHAFHDAWSSEDSLQQ